MFKFFSKEKREATSKVLGQEVQINVNEIDANLDRAVSRLARLQEKINRWRKEGRDVSELEASIKKYSRQKRIYEAAKDDN